MEGSEKRENQKTKDVKGEDGKEKNKK